MAFRKRNNAIGRTPATSLPVALDNTALPGVRPSPLTSHAVTSTGTASLDGLLGGHAGLALGSSLLIEESGTTDFAGALLRYYAAEGICQGHVVHVVGVGEGWVRELPGVGEAKNKDKPPPSTTGEDRMKIAWRYERLGQAGERVLAPGDQESSSAATTPSASVRPFCHGFDLTKRLALPLDANVHHIALSPTATFEKISQELARSLASSPPGSVHRLVMPAVLSPALYPPYSSRPEGFLGFLRTLRTLLQQESHKLTAVMTLPLDLYPRSSGIVAWAEVLCEGVLELTPFPHLMDASNNVAESGSGKGTEEQPQGMLRFHKLPITTERGEGGAGTGNSMGDDLAFTVSRRNFVIKPFSLPPLEGDQEAQKDAGRLTAKAVDF